MFVNVPSLVVKVEDAPTVWPFVPESETVSENEPVDVVNVKVFDTIIVPSTATFSVAVSVSFNGMLVYENVTD
jgi:hypothetical protein